MAKYRKNNNNAKKIKQASKDYGTGRRRNIEENINQMPSSSSSKVSNTRYDETTDPTSWQHKSFENSDLSRDNNLGRTELEQSEVKTNNSPSSSEKSELKPLVVYDIAAKDGITEADTNTSTKESVVLPYEDKDEVMTSNPFQATISLWQSYVSAWFRVWNEFFTYPRTITGEIAYFRLDVFIQRRALERRSQ